MGLPASVPSARVAGLWSRITLWVGSLGLTVTTRPTRELRVSGPAHMAAEDDPGRPEGI
jgi:hypothetical protein